LKKNSNGINNQLTTDLLTTMKSLIILTSLLSVTGAIAQDAEKQEPVTTKAVEHKNWVNLLEPATEKGHDGLPLKQWRTVSCDKSTFTLIDDKENPGEKILVCTGKPIGLLRTAEVYENFVVELEWRHMERDGMRANAGFFVWSDALPAVAIPFSRSVEVQVANFDKNTNWFTRHGDIFPIHGAKMTPDPRFGSWPGGQRSLPLEFRANGTGKWNKYRILCTDGTIQLEVNGKVVSGGYHAFPRAGHLMIESEGGEVHFRKMRVLPLKGSSTKLEDNAKAVTLPASTQVKPLYAGVTFEGWDLTKGKQFKPADYRISAPANAGSISIPAKPAKKSYTLQLDWYSKNALAVLPFSFGFDLPAQPPAKGKHRAIMQVTDGTYTLTLDGKEISKGKLDKAPVVTLKADAKEQVFFANVFLIQDHAK